MRSPLQSRSKSSSKSSRSLQLALVNNAIDDEEPAPLNMYDPSVSSDVSLRRSPTFSPTKRGSSSSSLSKLRVMDSQCLRRSPRLSKDQNGDSGDSSALKKSRVKMSHAGGLRRSPRLAGVEVEPISCELSSLQSYFSGETALKKMKIVDERQLRRSPRFAPDLVGAKIGKTECGVVAQGKKKSLSHSLISDADGKIVVSDVKCLEEKSLRGSPRLTSIAVTEISFPKSSSQQFSVKTAGSSVSLKTSNMEMKSSRGLEANTISFSCPTSAPSNSDSFMHLDCGLGLKADNDLRTSPRIVIDLNVALSNEIEPRPLSLLWDKDGNEEQTPSICKLDLYAEKHMRGSPRLLSATENSGSFEFSRDIDMELFDEDILKGSSRQISSLPGAGNIGLGSISIAFSKSSDEKSSRVDKPSKTSHFKVLEAKCLSHSPTVAVSVFGDDKLRCPMTELSEKEVKHPPKAIKTSHSSIKKRKKCESTFFIGDPVPSDEARERWKWRYEMKSQSKKGQNKKAIDDVEDEIVLNVDCHYTEANIGNCTFSLGDCAYIKGQGGQKHVGRIVEFFRTTEGENYFRVQWFYRVQDTVIKDEGSFHDKRRLFYSTKGEKLSSTSAFDFYYDMEYCLDYSTFRIKVAADTSLKCNSSILSNGADAVNLMPATTSLKNTSGREFTEKLELLDLYSGCGGMSTGLCLGAKLSCVDLVTRWSVDSNKSACESLKLNHPETYVRNESAENFLKLLKEWDRLSKRYGVNDSDITRLSRSKALKVANIKLNSKDSDDDEYEVASLIDICYGDPNAMGKHALHFKVRWKGYSADEDTWEPIEGLRNCHDSIKDFVHYGLKSKILPLPGDADVICGGPPCQGISGYNRFRNVESPLDDERNHQIVVFMDIVKFLQPKYVLMENVADILRFNKASLGRYALSRLVHMNYQARFGTIAAGCYGLPQFRLRVFLWGAHPREKLPQFPLPTHDVIVRYWPPPEFERNTVAYDENQHPELEKAVLLQDAISDLPHVTSQESREEMSYGKPPETEFQRYIRSSQHEMIGSALNCTTKSSKLYDHRPYSLYEDDYIRVCNIPKRKGANFRDLPGVIVGNDNVARRDIKNQILLPSGKPMIPDYALNFDQGKSKRPFGRLWWDETVPTVLTYPDCHSQAALHPEQDRVITIRECARLQGFPDYYRFCGTIKQRYCQIGNAVAVPVARTLGYSLGLAFRKISDDEPVFTLPPKFSLSNYFQLIESFSHDIK